MSFPAGGLQTVQVMESVGGADNSLPNYCLGSTATYPPCSGSRPSAFHACFQVTEKALGCPKVTRELVEGKETPPPTWLRLRWNPKLIVTGRRVCRNENSCVSERLNMHSSLWVDVPFSKASANSLWGRDKTQYLKVEKSIKSPLSRSSLETKDPLLEISCEWAPARQAGPQRPDLLPLLLQSSSAAAWGPRGHTMRPTAWTSKSALTGRSSPPGSCRSPPGRWPSP